MRDGNMWLLSWTWSGLIGLEQYIDALLAARYDTMEDLCQIEASTLTHC